MAHRSRQPQTLDLHPARGGDLPRRHAVQGRGRALEFRSSPERAGAAIRPRPGAQLSHLHLDGGEIREDRRHACGALYACAILDAALPDLARLHRQPDPICQDRKLAGLPEGSGRHRSVQGREGDAAHRDRTRPQRGVLGQEPHPEGAAPGADPDPRRQHPRRRAALRPGGLDRISGTGFDPRIEEQRLPDRHQALSPHLGLACQQHRRLPDQRPSCAARAQLRPRSRQPRRDAGRHRHPGTWSVAVELQVFRASEGELRLRSGQSACAAQGGRLRARGQGAEAQSAGAHRRLWQHGAAADGRVRAAELQGAWHRGRV